jgi:hypothetical protein
MSKTLQTLIEAADSAEHDPDRKLSEQIESGLRAIDMAVKETGESGTLTITVKVEPGAENRLNVQAGVKVKKPPPSVPVVTLYTDENGGLARAQFGLFGDQKKTTRSPQEN